MPLKSAVSTTAASDNCATSSSVQSRSGSSLNRSSGYSARQPATFAIRVETTNRTGLGVRPIASASVIPAWRSARSSAADSSPQRRYSVWPDWSSENESSVCVPASAAAPRLELLLNGGVVVDLFAAAFLAGATEDDHGPPQREPTRDLLLERLELVAVDVQRQVLDAVVGRHAHEPRW